MEEKEYERLKEIIENIYYNKTKVELDCITLNIVLFVIYRKNICIDNNGKIYENILNTPVDTNIRWNLTKNNLDMQSNKLKEFLYNLIIDYSSNNKY